MSDTDAYQSWVVIGKTVSDLLEMVVANYSKLPLYEFDANTYDKFRDLSIYGVLAEGIYEFLEKLSMYRKDDESIRLLAIGLWLEVAPISTTETPPAVLEIQKRLAVHLEKMVSKNLTKGHYGNICHRQRRCSPLGVKCPSIWEPDKALSTIYW